MAAMAASRTSPGPSSSGKPCPRLMAPVRTASALISAKMVGRTVPSAPSSPAPPAARRHAPRIVIGPRYGLTRGGPIGYVVESHRLAEGRPQHRQIKRPGSHPKLVVLGRSNPMTDTPNTPEPAKPQHDADTDAVVDAAAGPQQTPAAETVVPESQTAQQ